MKESPLTIGSVDKDVVFTVTIPASEVLDAYRSGFLIASIEHCKNTAATLVGPFVEKVYLENSAELTAKIIHKLEVMFTGELERAVRSKIRAEAEQMTTEKFAALMRASGKYDTITLTAEAMRLVEKSKSK